MFESEQPNKGPIRTLIVDDSPFVRKVVRDMLLRSPFIDVIGMAHGAPPPRARERLAAPG